MPCPKTYGFRAVKGGSICLSSRNSCFPMKVRIYWFQKRKRMRNIYYLRRQRKQANTHIVTIQYQVSCPWFWGILTFPGIVCSILFAHVHFRPSREDSQQRSLLSTKCLGTPDLESDLLHCQQKSWTSTFVSKGLWQGRRKSPELMKFSSALPEQDLSSRESRPLEKAGKGES